MRRQRQHSDIPGLAGPLLCVSCWKLISVVAGIDIGGVDVMTKRPERKEFETKQQWMKEIQKGFFFFLLLPPIPVTAINKIGGVHIQQLYRFYYGLGSGGGLVLIKPTFPVYTVCSLNFSFSVIMRSSFGYRVFHLLVSLGLARLIYGVFPPGAKVNSNSDSKNEWS